MRVFTRKTKKIFIFLLIIGSIERFCRLQTDGFRIEKTKGFCFITPTKPVGKPLDPKIAEMLKEPYTFLGSGVQSYAFVSADGQKVLKFFKHYHAGLPTHLLQAISWPKQLSHWSSRIFLLRSKRMEAIYNSHQLAFTKLRKETGLLHLQLEPCIGSTVTIYDKIGILHTIDVSQTPFVLQRRAVPIFTSLQEELKNGGLAQAKQKIDSLLTLITNRSKKGIFSSDPIIYRNFGFIGNQAIEIDMGSYVEGFLRASPFILRKELYLITCELQEWLSKHSPELADYLMQKILYETP